MNLSRRTWFFLVISITMLLLYEPTPDSLRWVNLSLAGLSLVWFVLYAIEDVSRDRRDRRRMRGGPR